MLTDSQGVDLLAGEAELYGRDISIDAVLDASLAAHARRRRGKVRSHLEFAHTLVYPGGPREGESQRPEDDPTQRWVVRQFDSGVWSRIYWLGSPQITGKTEVAIKLPLLRAAIDLRLPVGYGLPTLESMEKMYQSKIREGMVRSGYGGYFPLKGPGSRGGKPPFLRLRDPENGVGLGAFFFCTPGAYGDTVAVMIVDDLDQLRTAAGKPNWKGLEDLYHRCDSYDQIGLALRIGCGTLESDDASMILVLVNDHGTGTRLHAGCPYCRAHHIMEWKNIVYDASDLDAARETARYRCPLCRCDWTQADRVDALHSGLFVHRGQSVEDGRVVGPEPRTGGVLGLTTTAWDCVRSDLGKIVADYLHAARLIDGTGDHELMRKWTRYNECKPYTGDLQTDERTAEITPECLAARSSAAGWGDLIEDTDDGRKTWSCHYASPAPDDAQGIAVACDVQGDRLYWQGTAYAIDEDGWIEWDMGWGYESATWPHQPWASDDEFSATWQRFHRSLGLRLLGAPITDCVCDVRFKPDMVAMALRKTPDCRAIHGSPNQLPSSDEQIIDGQLSYNAKWKPGLGCYSVRTRAVRRLVHDGYRRTPGERGSIVLPRDLRGHDYYLRHLCSRRLVVNEKTHKEDWKHFQLRDDLLDCKTYAHAMILRRYRELIDPKKTPRVVSAADWFGR